MEFLSRFKYPLVLIMAAACAVGAVFLTKHYFEAKERELRDRIRQESQLTDVVVASRDLQPGARVDLKSMKIKSIPFEFVPDGAVTPDQYSSVEFKFLSDPVSMGKPLLRHFVEGISRVEKFSDVLAIGERAITLEVDGASSVEHMIEAGDYIDLAVRKNRGVDFSLLLERVKVLSTGNFTVADPKAPNMYKSAQYGTITLGVDGAYVQDIFEAESSGSLVFLLRNEKDEGRASYEMTQQSLSEVVVYSGGDLEGGILKAKTELVQKSIGLEPHKNVIRNSKGRVIRIADDTNTEVDNKESSLKNEFATNTNE